ncbi:hypothetical protein P9112_009616 [Eukaryota sp. TZLM1-RC]
MSTNKYTANYDTRNQEATIYVGNLDPQADEPLLYELFLQVGPVVNVHMPKDPLTNAQQGFGFVEFRTEEDADYAIRVMNMIRLYGKPLRVNKAHREEADVEIGANLHVSNLAPQVDEVHLYNLFSHFGYMPIPPRVMRDPDTGISRGFAFVSFDSFESSDNALKELNGQAISGRPMSISYAMKQDSSGVRHGTEAERKLVEERRHQIASGSIIK